MLPLHHGSRLSFERREHVIVKAFDQQTYDLIISYVHHRTPPSVPTGNRTLTAGMASQHSTVKPQAHGDWTGFEPVSLSVKSECFSS